MQDKPLSTDEGSSGETDPGATAQENRIAIGDRPRFAYIAATGDDDLHGALRKQGATESEIRKLHLAIQGVQIKPRVAIDAIPTFEVTTSRTGTSSIDCGSVREAIRDTYAKDHPARRVLMDYRMMMTQWCDEASVAGRMYQYPPQKLLHTLPVKLPAEMTPEEAVDFLRAYVRRYPEYQKAYMRAVVEYGHHNPHDAEFRALRDRNAPTLELLMHARTADIETDRQMILGHEMLLTNLGDQISKYVSADPTHALHVLTYSIDRSPEMFETVLSQFSVIIKTLAKNPGFVRAAVALVCDNMQPQPHYPLDPKKASALLLGLVAAKAIPLIDYAKQDLSLVEPREHSINEAFIDQLSEGPTTSTERHRLVFGLPADMVPVEWNNHRIVDPTKNPQMQMLSQALSQSAHGTDADVIRASSEKLAYQRTKAISGHRFMRCTSLQDELGEDTIVWFVFSHIPHAPENNIRVEVIMHGASIIYDCIEKFVDGAHTYDLELPLQDISYPASHVHAFTGCEMPRSIFDDLYVRPEIQHWLPPAAEQRLRRLVLEYAACMLCNGTTKRKGKGSSESSNAPLSSTPAQPVYSSLKDIFAAYMQGAIDTVKLPATFRTSQTTGIGAKSNGAADAHFIGHHIRKLPAGQQASPEAREKADRHGMPLGPGQTFVKDFLMPARNGGAAHTRTPLVRKPHIERTAPETSA